jgi:O-methyltransferase
MVNNLLSDQVNRREIEIIIRELQRMIINNISGDVVELGCYVGTTSVFLAKTLESTNKKLYVYDSFEGLPDKTKEDISSLGAMFQPGELMATKKQFIKNIIKSGVPMPIIKKAWFADLTANDIPDKIAFAYLDGDYYDSVAMSLELIEDRLSPGAVIIIDDYSNDALPGVSKAVDKWLYKHMSIKKVEQSLAILYINEPSL